MRIYRMIFLFLPLPLLLAAQPSFTSSNEFKIGSAAGGGAPPSVAIGASGDIWVVWNAGSRLIHPDGTPDPAGPAAPSGGYLPMRAGSNWGIIDRRDSCYAAISMGCTYNYRYRVYSPGGAVDSSEVLFQSHKESTFEDGSSVIFFLATGTADSGILHLAANSHSVSTSSGWFSTGIPRSVVVYDFPRRILREVFATPGIWYLGDAYIQSLAGAKDYGIPITVVSPARDGRFILLDRAIDAQLWNRTANSDMHQRRVKIFDTAGDSLSGFITIDSVATESTDLSDYILLGDNDFSIIRRAAPSDTMVVERFALDGSRISKPAFFLDHVSMNKCIGYAPVLDTIYHNRRADLTIAGLPDHTWLASWSRIQSDGTTDVYAGLFDEQFHPLGPAKRVNSDPTGNQSAPALAIDGDDACIAWVDGRSGEREIYLRRFRTNQILGAERTEAPAPVRITDIYPQPAKEYLTILYSHPSDAGPLKGTVTLFDALGRTVLHQPLPEGEEERRILLATDHLPAGLYLAALDFGTQRKGARILLVR